MSAVHRLLGLDGPALERRGLVAAGALGLAVAAVVTTLVFVGFAAQVVLADHMSPAGAALVVALAAALVAVGCLAWARHTVRRARRDLTRSVKSSALVALGAPAAALARRHLGVTGVVAAIGAGFWLARRMPRTRRDREES